MLGGKGKSWKDTQWLVLDGLDLLFRNLECILRGSCWWILSRGRVNSWVLEGPGRFASGLDWGSESGRSSGGN